MNSGSGCPDELFGWASHLDKQNPYFQKLKIYFSENIAHCFARLGIGIFSIQENPSELGTINVVVDREVKELEFLTLETLIPTGLKLNILLNEPNSISYFPQKQVRCTHPKVVIKAILTTKYSVCECCGKDLGPC